MTSPLQCVVSLRRGPGRRDAYATTQLNLGEIPLLSRRPSPAISAATDVDDQPHNHGGDVRHGQLLQPQQQRLLVLEAVDYLPPSKDGGATVSACSTASMSDDLASHADAAASADDNDGEDGVQE